MNIVLANTFYPPDGSGGAERSVGFLAERLALAGHRVSVLCTSKSQFKSKVNGVHIFGLGKLNIYWIGSSEKPSRIVKVLWHIIDIFNLLSLIRSYTLLKDIKPDVLHTNNLTGISPSIILAAKILKIPIVHTLRDYYLGCIHSNAINSSLACPKVKLVARFLSDRVNIVVGNSSYILEWHKSRNYFSHSKSYVVFNGYSYSGKVSHDKKSENEVVFGYIGSLSNDKGVELLCTQFQEFQELYQGKCMLLIAGGGKADYVKRLKEQYQSNTIIFLGYSSPVKFYKRIDWNVVPSQWAEPLARVCFEPKFFALPVISSCRGGNPEALNDGKDGLLFDPNIDGHLLEKLHLATRVNYKEFSINSFEDRRRFTLDKLVSSYISIYSEAKSANN